jgi:dihydroxyacid dehydratase/phosphogluconate dehydratase
VHEDLTPSAIMTKAAFENAIAVASAIGASTNCPIHMNAIARHVGVDLTNDDWQRVGQDVHLLVDCQPAGRFLGEDFYRAGGTPAVMHELLRAGRLHGDALTVSGRTAGENVASAVVANRDVIRPYEDPLLRTAGLIVMSGNLFDSAVMKSSVIGEIFRNRYLSDPAQPDVFVARAIVFEGPEDYHARINDRSLGIDENCILVMRNTGPIGYPGSAEVVNMDPPDALVREGISLPTLGDGRQSGTSDSPSILNASPESAVGGGLALIRTGDLIQVDLRRRRVDVLLSDDEIEQRRKSLKLPELESQTPWQEIYRSAVGPLSTGACFEPAVRYQHLVQLRGLPRHSH